MVALDVAPSTSDTAAPHPAHPRRRAPSMAVLFALVFATAGWRSGLSRLSDNSFFWHLRTGRWILDHGVPRHDIWSFSAPHTAWVAQSWLAEVLYGALDRAGGGLAVRMLGAVTGAAIAATAYFLAHRIAVDRLRTCALAAAAVGASFTLWSERPLFLGILAFVGVLWVVELPSSWPGRRPLVALPVLFVLWANVHGTFALGLAYLGLHLAGRWLDGAPPWQGRERRLALAALTAFAACFVNPYGPALVAFPVHLLGRGAVLAHVIEWRSPSFRSPQGLALAGWVVVWAACVARGHVRPSRRDLVVSVPFLLLALWAMRNIAVAPLVMLPTAARAVATRRDRPDHRSVLHWGFAAAVVGLAAMWFAAAAAAPTFDTREYPVDAMGAVEQHGLLGHRLLASDTAGGYIILHYGPAQPVFVDDRFDMYPRPVLNDFLALTGGDPGWRSILDRNRIEVVVWAPRAPLSSFLGADPGWRLLYRDTVAVVYVRS